MVWICAEDGQWFGRWMHTMELPSRRQRGRYKRRVMDVVREVMKIVGASGSNQ